MKQVRIGEIGEGIDNVARDIIMGPLPPMTPELAALYVEVEDTVQVESRWLYNSTTQRFVRPVIPRGRQLLEAQQLAHDEILQDQLENSNLPRAVAYRTLRDS